MTSVDMKTSVEFEFHLKITEKELRALVELAAYGPREVTGKLITLAPSTLAKSEEGIISFLAAIRDAGGRVITRVDKARKEIE